MPVRSRKKAMVYILVGRTRDGAGRLLEICTPWEWGAIRRAGPGTWWAIVGKLAGGEVEAEWCRRNLPGPLRRRLMFEPGWELGALRTLVLFGLATVDAVGLPIDES